MNRKKMMIAPICFLISISFACAGQKAKGKDPQTKNTAPQVSARVAVDIFSSGDQNRIQRHFSNYRGNLPPGLAKRRGDLPPGLEKQLRRNGRLPPGLEKGLYPFPIELERDLPPLREGLMRGIIGGSAVIMNKNTSIILDVFKVF